MSNRRPNSCPDPWKHESDFSDDRPKSVFGVQNQGDSKHHEKTLDTEEFTAGENNEFNKAKVNPWIQSKSKDKEKAVPNVSSGGKLFYHYPQRRVSPAVSSESSGTTRPQTEPGRTRHQMFSDDVKTQARRSIHDIASASTGTGTEKAEPEGDWVIVEKPTSETDMPCDPEDDTNVLVPSPNENGEETRENLEREKLQKTQMLLANTFGSTFKVLPEPRDKTTSGTGEETSATGGTGTKVFCWNERALGENLRFLLEVEPHKLGKTSMGNIMTFAASITKWKQRRATVKSGFATLDPEHRQLLATESDNMKTEIPEAMMRTIKEEAYNIVLKTTQAYRSQIGSKHRLTTEAYEFLKDLREELHRT